VKVELEHRGLSESTIRSAYTILRAVLDTAVRDRALAQNPAHAVRRPRVPVREAAYLTPDQVRSVLLAAKPSRYAPLLELLVNTGLRRGEALALHWSDIDFDEKLLRVRGTLARVDGELVVTETKTPRRLSDALSWKKVVKKVVDVKLIMKPSQIGTRIGHLTRPFT
jgi:integrase